MRHRDLSSRDTNSRRPDGGRDIKTTNALGLVPGSSRLVTPSPTLVTPYNSLAGTYSFTASTDSTIHLFIQSIYSPGDNQLKMHFSTLAISMLAANAAAWHHRPHYVHTDVVTITAPAVTEIATAPAEVIKATTLITKKASSKSSTTSVAPVATTVATTTSSSSSLTADQQAALDAHNDARAEVGNADLTWDETLAAGAQEWATHLVSVGDLVHSETADLGENLYMQYSTDAPYLNAVKAFVSEKSEYNGEVISESNYMSFGHYSKYH